MALVPCVYVCPKCRKAYPLKNAMQKCPECNSAVLPQGRNAAIYNKYTDEEKQKFIDDMLGSQSSSNVNVTTCEKFEGKEIEAYYGVVYGTGIYLVGGLVGGGMANQEVLFGTEYNKAIEKMYQKAISIGGNAIVGMQTALTSAANNIILTVSGTAVKLKE